MSKKTKEEVVEEFRCASIQDAAMRVIARKGIDEATIQDIADEAGIAKGTVYLYFRDRDELIARTADRAFEKLVADLEPAFNAPGSFAGRLLGVITRQLQFFDENRSLFRPTLALSQAGVSKPRTGCYGLYATRLEQMFADARESGEMRDLDPLAIAAVYRDLVRGAIVRRTEQKSQKRPSPAEDAKFIASVLLDGIQEN
jgi:TetR/AcrR family fatty acid metabolism transcriptional regulator